MPSFDLAPIEHGSLTERAVETLLDHVLSRRLEPGTSLPSVAALSETLGVSRPVVREALNALKALGLVEIANGKKATIRDLDNDVLRVYFRRAVHLVDGSIRDVMDVRIGIEIRAASLAARNRTDEDLDDLRDITARMAASVGDTERFSRHDTAFHLALAEASGNQLLFHVLESLETALRAASYEGMRALGLEARPDAILGEHRRILEAIERSDEAAAATLMHDHIASAMRRMGLSP